MPPPRMFNVRITFDASEGGDIRGRLVHGLGATAPHLAKSIGVGFGGGYAWMEFEPVSDAPGGGATTVENSTAGAEVVAALEGFSRVHSPAIPALRALLTATAAIDAAGLPPRSEMRIDVIPAQPLPQKALSTHWSESVHPPRRRFGARAEGA